MENEFNDSLNKALKTSFIDMEYLSDKTYQTKFILNNPDKEKKILSYLTNRVEKCKNFWISAAFLTMSGVSCLRTKFDIFAEDKNKRKDILFRLSIFYRTKGT